MRLRLRLNEGGVIKGLHPDKQPGGVSEKVESQRTSQKMARKDKGTAGSNNKGGTQQTGWMCDERAKTDKN